MSEERFQRLEDMMGQLIGMVGKVISEQEAMRADMNEMKADMKSANERLERVESNQIHYKSLILWTRRRSTIATFTR